MNNYFRQGVEDFENDVPYRLEIADTSFEYDNYIRGRKYAEAKRNGPAITKVVKKQHPMPENRHFNNNDPIL